jgi:hypothetical protein
MRKVQFLWFFHDFLGYELVPIVVSQLFWSILGFLLTIFVSFFVLFDKNLLFFMLVLFVLSQPRNSEKW